MNNFVLCKNEDLNYCLLGVAFFLPLSVWVTNLLLVIAAVLWIHKRKPGNNSFLRTKIDLWILLFTVVAAASIFVSPDWGFSTYNFILLWGRYLLLYWLFANSVTSFRQVKQIIVAMLLSALLVSLYGVFQYFSHVQMLSPEWIDKDQFPDIKTRVFSTLYNPNLLAAYLVAVISLTLSFIGSVKQTKEKCALAVILISCLACLVFTYSRGAWLSLLIMILLLGTIVNRKLLWSLMGVPALIFLFKESLLKRLYSIVNPSDTSATLRIALWESTVEMIKEHPWLGIGWGAYWLVYPEYNFFIEDAQTIIYHAHNMYLNIMAELGILGLTVYLVIVFFHLSLVYRLYKSKLKQPFAVIAVGLAAAVISFLISGLTDYVLFNVELSMMFWLLLALIRSINKLRVDY